MPFNDALLDSNAVVSVSLTLHGLGNGCLNQLALRSLPVCPVTQFAQNSGDFRIGGYDSRSRVH